MKLSFLLPVLIAPLFISCGGAQAVNTPSEALTMASPASSGSRSESRELKLGTFSSIENNSVVKIVYTQKSGGVKATLTGDPELLDRMEVYVKGSKLVVTHTGSSSLKLNGRKIVLTLSAPALSEVVINGTGDFTSSSMDVANLNLKVNGTGDIEIKTVKSTDLSLIVNGTGDIEVDRLTCNSLTAKVNGTGDVESDNVSAKSVKAVVNGTGEIELKGMAGSASYSMTGTGDIKAFDMKATDVDASNTGTGSIRCNAQRSITAKCTFNGEIIYMGNPTKVNVSKGVRHKAK